MASCPASTPRLKPTSASTSDSCGKPRSDSTLAKPKPWIKPNTKAIIQRRSRNSGNTLLSAAISTEAAMVDSTSRDGKLSTPSAASDKVIECATVNAVTTFSTDQNAGLKADTPCQVLCSRTPTAGSSSANRN